MPINKFDVDKILGKREIFDANLYEVKAYWDYLSDLQKMYIVLLVVGYAKKRQFYNWLAFMRAAIVSALGAVVIEVPTVSRPDEISRIWRNLPKDQRDTALIDIIIFLHKKRRREVLRVVIVSALGDLCGVLPHMLPIVLLLPVIMRW